MKKMKCVLAIVTLLTFFAGSVIAAGIADQININSASREELMQLEGVGSSYAQKIIEYREANGPFQKPEEIMNVKGIGESIFEKNKGRITVGVLESN